MSDAMPRSLAEKIVWLQQQLERERRAEEDERAQKQIIIIKDSRSEAEPSGTGNSPDVAPVSCAPEPESEPAGLTNAEAGASAGANKDQDEQKQYIRIDVAARARTLAAAEARRIREHARSGRPATASRVRPVRHGTTSSASAPSATQGQTQRRDAPVPCQCSPVAGTHPCVQCHKGGGDRAPGDDVPRENERRELDNETHAPPAEGNDQAKVTEACDVSIKIEVEDHDGVVRAMPMMLQLKLKEEEEDKANILNLSDPKGSDEVRGQETQLERGEKEVSKSPTQTKEPEPKQTNPAATQATTAMERMMVDNVPEVLPDVPNSSRRNTLSHTWFMTSDRLSLSVGQKRTRPDDRDDVGEEDERGEGGACRNESNSSLDRTQDTRERRSTWPGARKKARWDSGMTLEAPALRLVQTAQASSSKSLELSSCRSNLGGQDEDDTLDKARKKALDSTTTKEVERYWVQASRGTLQAAARLCQLRAQMKVLDMEMAEILRHLGEVEVAVENIPV